MRKYEVINEDTLEKIYEGTDEPTALRALASAREAGTNAAFGSWVEADD